MKTTKYFIFFILFEWLGINLAFSQTKSSWMRDIDINILDKVMNIELSQPSGFVGVGDSTSTICFDSNPGFYCCPDINLVSEDRSFIVCYSIYNPLTKEDSIKFYPNAKNNVVDMRHIEIAENIVKRFFGKDADWKNYVHYYPSNDVKARFNADTVFSLSLMPDKGGNQCYDNDYSNCTILFFQKKGRGYVTVHCIYNEKAEDKLDSYMAAIEGSLKYREGEPELTRIDGGDAIVEVKWNGNRRK